VIKRSGVSLESEEMLFSTQNDGRRQRLVYGIRFPMPKETERDVIELEITSCSEWPRNKYVKDIYSARITKAKYSLAPVVIQVLSLVVCSTYPCD